METLAVVNTKLLPKECIRNREVVNISGTNVVCGIVNVTKPNFDIDNPKNSDFVLVRVDAFSCNYRDKALIVKESINIADQADGARPVSFFGSDFVGTVVNIGKNVTNLKVGMRVIPNCYYPYQEYDGVATGVVTNEASKGWLKLHKSKLLPIPDEMEDEVAASFSIGGQTSSSMIRRSNIQKGDKVLVTSSRSNTSMFIIRKLISMGIDVTALTTSNWTEDELKFVAPAKIIKIQRGLRSWEQLNIGKFDVIFDPFYDLNLLNSIPRLNFNGRYITCGFKNQHDTFKEDTDDRSSDKFDKLMVNAMINNLYIIGNCIGTTNDLKVAISTYDASKRPVKIDEVVELEQGAEFLEQTYNSKGRFGKVVMKYKNY